MKIQGVLAALTVVNVALLAVLLTQARPAQAGDGAAVIRGTALEIVDERGRVRASIKLQAGDPKFKMPDGTIGVPETVMFRLIDANGRPGIKVGASEEGSGISVAGDSEREDWNGIQIIAKAAGGSVKITNKDGRHRLLKP